MSGNCVKCGRWRESLHKDHVIPKWKGGLDEISNIQFLCSLCHEDKTREEFQSVEYKAFRSADSKMRRWSAEQKAAHGARQRGKKKGPYKNRGVPLTEERKEKLRNGWTLEAREAARQRMLGKKLGPPSAETRAKISAANSGKSMSIENRAKKSKTQKGRSVGPFSETHIAALREARRKRSEFEATLTAEEKAKEAVRRAENTLASLQRKLEIETFLTSDTSLDGTVN